MEVLREFDPWKGPLCTCPPKYSLQPYTGCPFSCLYCYATSYIRRRFEPKKNFIERLKRDLRRADKEKIINMSTSSDPYPPIEEKLMLTRKALQLILSHGFKVLITTKGNLVARDRDLLENRPAAVMITITTLDERLARKLEPGAPSPEERLRALKALGGVPKGIRLDPLIPGVNDDEEAIKEVLVKARAAGAQHVTTSTYKAKPDNLARMAKIFPRLKELYARGIKIGSYRYLPEETRKKMLEPVVEISKNLGMTVAFCREGFPFDAPSCDGSHLIYTRSNVNKQMPFQ